MLRFSAGLTRLLWALIATVACGPGGAADRAGVRVAVTDAARGTSAPPPAPGSDGAAGMSGAASDAGAVGGGGGRDAGMVGSPAPADGPGGAPVGDSGGASPQPGPGPADAATPVDGPPPLPPDARPPPDAFVPDPNRTATLPLVVTDHFVNQGWFADPALSTSFAPGSTTIRQVASTQGLCGARARGARGRCLDITFTPPGGLPPPPEGGWVGVYFLGALRADHLAETPPLRAGEPNWGVEPGQLVMPGATRVSFYAAAATANLQVTFRSGSDRDEFILPEQTETLTGGWVRYTISLDGASYDRVIGPFLWLLKDTSKPARFFLDDIVWETPANQDQSR
jgi:hypothetical protein